LKQGFTLGKTLYKYVALNINNQSNDSLEINQTVLAKISVKVKAIYNKKLWENIRDLFKDLLDIRFYSESSFESVNKTNNKDYNQIKYLQCTKGKDDGFL